MNKVYGGIIASAVIATAAFVTLSNSPAQSVSGGRGEGEKVYVALEEEGKIAVIDAARNQMLRTIDLSEEKDDGIIKYMAHNVQVAPDGSGVLVTANVNDKNMQMQMGSSTASMDMGKGLPDELIVVDPKTDLIVKRIPIEPEAHLAHVVFAPESSSAWITEQQKDTVVEIDPRTGAMVKSIGLPAKSGPHGLRLTPDGSKAVIALVDGKGIALLDTKTGAVELKPEPGAAVQTAITPDGEYALASIYDTKQVAWFSLKDDSHGFIDLPKEAKGPVQLYPSPDSRAVYVADQGHYFNQPDGNAEGGGAHSGGYDAERD